MTSIYQRALGDEFEKLHPMVKKRFGFGTDDGTASIGRGIMEKIWVGPAYTMPILWLGSWRNVMFPEAGENVPFQVENYAYRDSFGRETVTWLRTFDFGAHRRRFDATMIYSEERKKIVDYLGTHQHFAVETDLSVAPNKGLQLNGRVLRFYEGEIALPFPAAIAGLAEACEWFDDATGRHRIEVKVTNPNVGPLFGYSGWFEAEFKSARSGDVPSSVKPLREERRE